MAKYFEPCCRSVGYSQVPISTTAGLGIVEVSVPPAPCKRSAFTVDPATGAVIRGNLLPVKHPHPSIDRGVHPNLAVEGGVIWMGQREPRVPQVMCLDCVAEMEASGEYNSGP